MSTLYEYFYAGGPYFMFPSLLILIVIIILIVKGFLNLRKEDPKTLPLISSIGLFALIWGVFGQLLGLFQAFDYIQISGEVPATVLAGGLKVSMISTIFGVIIFLISRLGIISLTWFKNKQQ